MIQDEQEFQNITGISATEFQIDMLALGNMNSKTSYEKAVEIAHEQFKHRPIPLTNLRLPFLEAI
jgi:hypothetical protein